MDAKNKVFYQKNEFLTAWNYQICKKNRAFIRSFRIITRFWCGRQELKIYDDKKKALIFKAFLLLNANVDAKIFLKRIMGLPAYL